MLAKPFEATAATRVVAPTGSSQTVAIDNLGIGAQNAAILIQNASSVDIAVVFGTSVGITAAFPTVGVPARALVVPAGGGLIGTTPAGTTHVAVIGTGVGAGSVYLTPGFGL